MMFMMLPVGVMLTRVHPDGGYTIFCHLYTLFFMLITDSEGVEQLIV